jgi:uncharacterized membrane protein
MNRSIARPSSTRPEIEVSSYQKFCVRRKIRFLSVACYFGFAPFLWMAGIEEQNNKYLKYHFHHSLVLSLLILFILIATAIVDALGYIYVVLWNPSLNDYYAMGWLVHLFEYTGNTVALAWVIAWLFTVISAWRGQLPQIPILSNIAQRKNWMRFSLGWTIFVRIALILLILMAAHGALLTMDPNKSPHVYILYTVSGYIPTEPLWATYTPPHWAFSLFFYPIITAATIHWGHGTVAIEPLSDVTFKEAIKNGHFVFVASHGGKEDGSFAYSFVPYRGFLPSDLQPGDAGTQLRYVYFAACYAGDRESEWRQVLAPADVQIYARITSVEEHFLWVWLKGAKVILNLN